MKILDGKQTSLDIQTELAEKVKSFSSDGTQPPHLAAILVGSDGASRTYVNAKVKACDRVGFQSTLIQYDDDVTELEKIRSLPT